MDTQQLKLILTADASGINTATGTAVRGVERLEGGVESLNTGLAGMARTGAAAFLGTTLVSSALAGSRALYEASAAGERLRTMLDYATGGKSAAEMVYITQVANRLGLDMQTTAQAFGSFAAAARGTSLEGDKARGVFEAVAKSSAVMGNTADETRGILLALQQMLSKGTVSAEELRGQLGERMPGAFQIAARSMGVTTQELGKMLEQGQVLSEDFLPKFARQLEQELGGAADKAAERLDAATNRINNAWERLKRNLGDSGPSAAAAGQLNILTDASNSISEAMELARLNGSGFMGQMLAATGAAAAFANPLNALSYNVQSLDEQIKRDTATLQKFDEQLRALASVGVRSIRIEVDAAQARSDLDALIAKKRLLTGDDGSAQSDARFARQGTPTYDPYSGAKSLDDTRKTAKLRQDIQREENTKAVEIAKAFGKAIAEAGEGSGLAVQLATERDERLKALRRETHRQLQAYDKSNTDQVSKTAKEQETAYTQAAKRIQSETAKAFKDAAMAVARQQAETQGLTAAQTEFLALAASPEWAAMNREEKARIALLTEKRVAQEAVVLALEAEKAATIASAALKRDLIAIELQATQAALDNTASVAEHIKRLDEETARMGLTTQELAALESARIAEALATAEATLASKIAAGARAEELEGVTLLVEELRKLQTAQRANAGKKAAVDTKNEWERASEGIEKSLTDALLRAFESGKGAGASFADTLKNMLKTQFLRPFLQDVVQQIQAMASSVFGSLGRVIGGQGGGGIAALLGGGQGGAAGQTGAAGSALGALGSLGSNLGAFYASYQISKMISGKYSMGGVLGTLGNLGGVVGGLFNRAFGRGPKETQAQGIEGSFGGGTAIGNAFADWKQDGGWFRSDKSGTERSAFSAEIASALDAGAKAVLEQSKVWADVLELPGANLANVNSKFRVEFGADEAANRKALEDAVNRYQDDMAKQFEAQLLPFKKAAETLGQTFGRLAAVQSFSATLNDLGGVFSRIANSTVDAREQLIELAGGMDALASQALGFVQNYYSAGEIAGVKSREIQAVLADAGITQDISTKEQFRALLEGQDPNTAAGREQIAALLKVQGDFAQVAEYLATNGGTLGSTAAQAPASGPLASLFAQQGAAGTEQVAAINTVATGVDLVRQAIETLTAVVKAGATMMPTAGTQGVREPYAWEVQP
jgi:tape measure domain-containing protein